MQNNTKTNTSPAKDNANVLPKPTDQKDRRSRFVGTAEDVILDGKPLGKKPNQA